MNRRDFLKTMLAASAAPAIVHAENIMKVWVPPKKKIVLPSNKIAIASCMIGHVDDGVRGNWEFIDPAKGRDYTVIVPVMNGIPQLDNLIETNDREQSDEIDLFRT